MSRLVERETSRERLLRTSEVSTSPLEPRRVLRELSRSRNCSISGSSEMSTSRGTPPSRAPEMSRSRGSRPSGVLEIATSRIRAPGSILRCGDLVSARSLVRPLGNEHGRFPSRLLAPGASPNRASVGPCGPAPPDGRADDAPNSRRDACEPITGPAKSPALPESSRKPSSTTRSARSRATRTPASSPSRSPEASTTRTPASPTSARVSTTPRPAASPAPTRAASRRARTGTPTPAETPSISSTRMGTSSKRSSSARLSRGLRAGTSGTSTRPSTRPSTRTARASIAPRFGLPRSGAQQRERIQ